MARQKLILVPSSKMDTNKKEGRNEHGLIRMSKATRDNMGYDKIVEIFPNTKSTEERLKSTMMLEIFHAFSEDIRSLREGDEVRPEEMNRVGFVTTRTFEKITGTKSGKPKKDIWISDQIEDTVVGADPEFLLFDKDGHIVRANNVMSYNGLLGCDGAMAEVRPAPATSPEELTAHIKSIFGDKKLTEKILPYDWLAGCYFKDRTRDYPIGGHIHIGNPIQVANLSMQQRERLFKVMNKIIDELVALPMVKIDGAELGRARRTECTMGKYGYFGEWRSCNGRLEHRTLSGMWLMHPSLVKCVFGTVKAIIDEIFNLMSVKNFDVNYALPANLSKAPLWQADFGNWDKIPLAKDMGCVTSSADMIEWLHTSSATNITAAYMRRWLAHMKTLSTYKKYSKYVDGLYEILKNNTKTFQEYPKELRNNWLNGNKFIGE